MALSHDIFRQISAELQALIYGKKKLEMCQYDTDAPAQGHPQPHAGILQKMKLKTTRRYIAKNEVEKGRNQSFFFFLNIRRKTSFEGEKGP